MVADTGMKPPVVASNSDAPPLPDEYVAVPTDLANRILGVLGNMPYVQVHDVVDALRVLPIRSS